MENLQDLIGFMDAVYNTETFEEDRPMIEFDL